MWPVWKSNFGRPTLRSCVCSMAWSFYAIDATLSPRPRRSMAWMLISTQVAPLAKDTVAVIRAACLTKKQPMARVGCAARLTVARLRKHIVKLVVLVVMGFSPLPFLLTFV